jgi:hypothetical protein
MYSIAMTGRPSCSSTSKMVTMFGWRSVPADCASRAKRVRASGETAYVGDLGWVMVRADKTPNAIRAALERGYFYATTGLLLSRVDLSSEGIVVEVAHDPARGGVVLEVIGEGGRVLTREASPALRFDPRGASGSYLRVRATAADGRRGERRAARTRRDRAGSSRLRLRGLPKP